MRCFLRFGGRRAGGVDRGGGVEDGETTVGGVDGGVEFCDGDTTVGGEADAVFVDACLSCLMRCLDLNFRPIDLLFRFIGIITSQ